MLQFCYSLLQFLRKLLIINDVTVLLQYRDCNRLQRRDRKTILRPMRIDIETDIAGLVLALDDIGKSQIPFAIAQTLNTLAFDGQRIAIQELAESLDIKTKWVTSGIQVNKADKRDYPKAYSEVGIEEKRAFIIDHIIGNAQRKAKGASRVAVPRVGQRGGTGRISKSKRVSTVLNRKGKNRAFVIKGAGENKAYLVRRKGSARYPLEILYAFKNTVTVRGGAFNFEQPVEQYARRNYSKVFGHQLGKAIRSTIERNRRAKL